MFQIFSKSSFVSPTGLKVYPSTFLDPISNAIYGIAVARWQNFGYNSSEPDSG